MSSRKYDRRGAAAYLAEKHGIKVAPQTLANLAGSGRGPRYSLLLNRATYTEPDLDRWVDAEFKRGIVDPSAAAA